MYIKGKYIWPLPALIWFVTILNIVAYKDSWLTDHLLLINLLKFVLKKPKPKININPIVRKNPILVIDRLMLLISKLSKLRISNCSKGVNTCVCTDKLKLDNLIKKKIAYFLLKSGEKKNNF